MKTKALIILVLLLVMGLGTAIGLYLIRNQQLLQKSASVPGGPATVSISPSTMTLNQDDTFTATVSFNPGGVVTQAVALRLEYTYDASLSQPPITATAVTPDPTLAADSQWTFTANSYEYQNGTADIYIAAFNTSVAGFNSNSETSLATITFKANSPGTINVTFNPTDSVITSKATAEDILLTPQSSGTYTVNSTGNNPTPTLTPTPTGIITTSPSPTPTGTGAQPTPTPTTSNSTNPTNTPTPTTTSNNNSSTNSVIISYPTNGSTITDTTPTFSGTASAGSTITVSVGSITGTTTTSTSGSWSWTPSTQLSGGSHTVTATSSAGGSATSTFTITTSTGSTTLMESGTFETTMIVLGVGIFLILGGAIVSLKAL